MKNRNSEEFKNLIIKLLMLSLFVIGALIFTYPFISDAINNYYDQKVISNYVEESNRKTEEERFQRRLELEEKNRQMLEERSTNVPGLGLIEDPFESEIRATDKMNEDYYRSHLLGAIYIPKIKVSLPVFDETNDVLLERGATLLQGTSFPIGGKSTHSVITSHSGLPEKRLFTDLEKLETGDIFYIEIEDEMLAYEIFEFKTVLPDEIDSVMIQDDLDLVTLLTCTPYMINSHRLLVTGKRIPYIAEVANSEIKNVQSYHETRVFYNVAGLILFVLIALLWAYRKYRYYQITKQTFKLKFDLSNTDLVSDKPYVLFNFLGQRNNDLKSASKGDVVEFYEVRGGKYYIGLNDDKMSRFKLVAKVRRGKFIVYYRKCIFSKQVVSVHE